MGERDVDVAPLIALSLAGEAAATTWWVRDGDEAAALSAALAEVWPEHRVDIEIGSVESDLDPVYLYVEDGVLVLVAPPNPIRKADVSDWPTRAVLARSWLRQVVVAAPLPPVMPPVMPPLAEPDAPAPESPAGGPWVTLLFGSGSRYPDPLPSVRFAIGTGLRWDRFSLGLGLDLELGEVVRSDAGGWFVRRFGIGVEGGLELYATHRWDLALLGRPTLRFIRAEQLGATFTREAQTRSGFAAGLAAHAHGPTTIQPTIRAEIVLDAQAALPGDLQVRPVGVFALVGASFRAPVKDRSPGDTVEVWKTQTTKH